MKFIPIFALCIAVASSSPAAERPNLVFIIADDCTYLDMGVYGGQAKTPTLDKLASEGMQFSRCFQAAPMCSPTRHNIYTGIYPVKSGAWPNHTFVYPGTKSIGALPGRCRLPGGSVRQNSYRAQRFLPVRVFPRVQGSADPSGDDPYPKTRRTPYRFQRRAVRRSVYSPVPTNHIRLIAKVMLPPTIQPH